MPAPVIIHPALAELLGYFDSNVRSHRLFALNFLIALRAQNSYDQYARLLGDYHGQLTAAAELAGARERLAWDLFRHHGLSKLVRIALYLAEKKFRILSIAR
jgi:hypothetical protein